MSAEADSACPPRPSVPERITSQSKRLVVARVAPCHARHAWVAADRNDCATVNSTPHQSRHAEANACERKRKGEEAMRLLVLGAFVFTILLAQAKPNFSGTWTLAASDSPAAAGGVKAIVVAL